MVMGGGTGSKRCMMRDYTSPMPTNTVSHQYTQLASPNLCVLYPPPTSKQCLECAHQADAAPRGWHPLWLHTKKNGGQSTYTTTSKHSNA